jgi:hypothetical protein
MVNMALFSVPFPVQEQPYNPFGTFSCQSVADIAARPINAPANSHPHWKDKFHESLSWAWTLRSHCLHHWLRLRSLLQEPLQRFVVSTQRQYCIKSRE